MLEQIFIIAERYGRPAVIILHVSTILGHLLSIT